MLTRNAAKSLIILVVSATKRPCLDGPGVRDKAHDEKTFVRGPLRGRVGTWSVRLRVRLRARAISARYVGTSAVGKPRIAASHEPAPPSLARQASITESQTALVKQYCATCHNDRNKNNAGGLSLASFDASKVGHDAQVAEVAEKMIRKLRSGMMPPPNARRPEAPRARVVCRVDGIAARSGRRAQSQSRPPSVPAPQSRRIHARGERAARDRRRRQRVPAARHDQRRLRQRRRRADVLGDADGRLPARREPHQLAGGRRSEGERLGVHLQGAAHRLADASRRGRAVRHARRHRGDAHVPGRRRIQLPHAAALDPDRPAVWQHGQGRAARSVDRRRARRGARDQPAHERSGSERHEHRHAADSRQGRHASPVGGVRAALRRGARRPAAADRSQPGRLADRIGLRHHDAAAPPRVRGERAVQGDRHVGNAEPQAHLHLPSDVGGRRSDVRE